ncbi:MAG: sulfotransferase [Thermoplasmata archaeon]|nr:sulfotransferase [Thermoplasmata archaeon]
MKHPLIVIEAHRRWIVGRDRAIARKKVDAYRHLFPNVERFCIFIGYPRSGHTLVGAILDAHRDMVVSNELDALKYVRAGLDRDLLFTLIMENSRASFEEGRTQTGYKYAVPNQHQGGSETLRVIGDKKGGATSGWLAREPGLQARLEEMVAVPVRYIHVTRNPFDNITTMTTRSGDDLQACIDRYFTFADTNLRLGGELGDRLIEIRLEDFIGDPRRHIESLCRFMGVDCPEDFVSDCAGIVFEKPKLTRSKIEWPERVVDRVIDRMGKYPFLAGYTFEE